MNHNVNMKNPNCQDTAQTGELRTKVSGKVVLKLRSSSGLQVQRSDCSATVEASG